MPPINAHRVGKPYRKAAVPLELCLAETPTSPLMEAFEVELKGHIQINKVEDYAMLVGEMHQGN